MLQNEMDYNIIIQGGCWVFILFQQTIEIIKCNINLIIRTTK